MKKLTFLFLAMLSIPCFSQEKLVKVNGVNYNVLTKGLEKRKPNTPVLVFENGMGVGLDNWDTVLDELSKVTPVLAYDRQGEGKSDKVYELPTPKRIAENLKAILSELKLAPPYILVGHSMGGVYVRAFAGYYPNDVAGLVFVDPADFTETKADWNQIFRTIGVPEKRIDEMIYKRLYVPSKVDSVHYGSWSEGQVLTNLRKTDFAELESLPVPQVSIYFFIGGKFQVPVDQRSKDFDHEKFFEVKNNANIERWKKFTYSSNKGSALIFLTNSGHFVHRDDAPLVIGNIIMLVEGIK